MSIPEIEAERLLLRPLTPDDAKAVFAWTGDSRVTEYMNYSTYSSEAQVRQWLETGSSGIWGYVRKQDGLLIGSGDISLSKSPDEAAGGFWGFGYCIRFDCWNKGYTTEATKAMIKYACECGARKFTAQHAVENPASGRVMEKCGLKFYGFGSYKKHDGSREYRSKVYRGLWEDMAEIYRDMKIKIY